MAKRTGVELKTGGATALEARAGPRARTESKEVFHVYSCRSPICRSATDRSSYAGAGHQEGIGKAPRRMDNGLDGDERREGPRRSRDAIQAHDQGGPVDCHDSQRGWGQGE